MGADTSAFPEFFMVQDTKLFPVDQRRAADERGLSRVWPSAGPKEEQQEAGSEATFLRFKAGGESGHLASKWLYQPTTRKLQEGGLQHLESQKFPMRKQSALTQKAQDR